MSDAITTEFLENLGFLAPATTAEAHQLASVARLEQVPVGAIIFREGNHLPQFYIVSQGTVSIEILGRTHRLRRVHTVGPGELLGWSPILGASAMTATARALTPVELVAIDAEAILDLCERDPRFGYLFMRRTAAAIAARLNSTRLQLLDVYGHDIPAVPLQEGGACEG
jgi:CRP-like cAMP-binding protein